MTMINADPEDFICGGLLWSDQDTCSKVAPAIPSLISCLIVAIPPQGQNAQEICMFNCFHQGGVDMKTKKH